MREFARYYRPKTLDEYVGNASIKRTLENVLSKESKPQSIMLYGPTGCGKTTLARLIAKEYLCENRDEVGHACNACENCQMIDDYIETGVADSIPDLVEVDITKSSGKGDIDSIVEEMSLPPMYNDWKIYVLDEFQSASNAAQQRLLKTLEEPEEGVLTIFCSTNPEKFLDTLKNRMSLKLKVNKPTLNEIVDLLKRVCINEGVKYEVAALQKIAVMSDFIFRESLQLLQRVVNAKDIVTSANVSEELEEVSEKLLEDFFEAFLNKDTLTYLGVLGNIRSSGGFDTFLTSSLSFLMRGIYVINGVQIEGLGEEEVKSFGKLFKKYSIEEISDILGGLQKLRGSRDIEAGLMSLLYKERVEVVQIPASNVKEEVLDIRSHRDKVLSERENEVISKSKEELVESLTAKASEEDIFSMFNIKKVRINE